MTIGEKCVAAYKWNEKHRGEGGVVKERLAAEFGCSVSQSMRMVRIGKVLLKCKEDGDDIEATRLEKLAGVSIGRAYMALGKIPPLEAEDLDRLEIARGKYREDTILIKGLVAVLKNNQVPESLYRDIVKGRV
jgi:hypothetical protein